MSENEAYALGAQLQAAEQRLDRLLDWIGRSDTKFSFVFGVAAAMLGFLSTSAPVGSLSGVTVFFALASVALLGTTLCFVYRGTYPRTRGPKGSLIYFDSIAGQDSETYRERFLECDTADHLNDVLDQIHCNSEILSNKFVELQRAYGCLLAALAPWALTLYLFGALPVPT